MFEDVDRLDCEAIETQELKTIYAEPSKMHHAFANMSSEFKERLANANLVHRRLAVKKRRPND